MCYSWKRWCNSGRLSGKRSWVCTLPVWGARQWQKRGCPSTTPYVFRPCPWRFLSKPKYSSDLLKFEKVAAIYFIFLKCPLEGHCGILRPAAYCFSSSSWHSKTPISAVVQVLKNPTFSSCFHVACVVFVMWKVIKVSSLYCCAFLCVKLMCEAYPAKHASCFWDSF